MDTLTPEELFIMRRLIQRAEEAQPVAAAIDAGDVAQIRPAADPVFGGMLLHVCQVRGGELRGYLLRPHRGGCREAWSTWTAPELLRIGHASAPRSAFARRCDVAQSIACAGHR